MIGARAVLIVMFTTVSWIGETAAQTAPDVMAQYRAMTSVAPKPCSKATDQRDIVVCSTRLRESQRIPYVQETRLGRRPLRALGEPPSSPDAPDRPTHCPIRGCVGDGSVLGAIGKLVERIRD